MLSLMALTRIFVFISPLLSCAQLLAPASDPFYTVPSNISEYANGAIVENRIRPVITTANNTKYLSSSRQIFYKTTGESTNASDGTVATVWVPTQPASPPKILSYQYIEDADAIDCDPSWALVEGSNSTNNGLAGIETPIVVDWALRLGYYVVTPDAEGSKSAWLVGNVEGHGVLDGIRAAISYTGIKNPQVALYGYSGAAHQTVWAVSLAQSYASELNIVGAAYGGTPTDLLPTYLLLNGTSGSGLAGEALFGLANGYPALNAYYDQVLNADGKYYQSLFAQADYCEGAHNNELANKNFSAIFNTDVLAPGTELSIVLARESLLMNVSSLPVPVPKFPRYEYHGNLDTTVSYPAEVQYVDQQCSKGANIAFNTIQLADHALAFLLGLPTALAFIQQAFNGTTPKVVCGSTIPFIELNSTQAQNLLGPEAVNTLQAAVNNPPFVG